MKAKTFILLIVLMSLSLIGIIFVQAYFINKSVENENSQFQRSVKETLSYVTRKLEDDELNKYFEIYQRLPDKAKLDSTAVSQLFIYQQNKNTNETVIYTQGILEENILQESPLSVTNV